MEQTREQMMASGEELLGQGKPAEAFAAFDAVVAENPEDVAALVRGGLALMSANDLVAAAHYLEQAARSAPEDAGVLWLLGAAALAGGRGALAREALEGALSLDGEDPELLLDLVTAAYYDLDVTAARGYAERMLEADPDNVEARAWLDKLEHLDDPHALLVDVGRAHCREGRLGEGVEHLTLAFEYGDSFEARLYAARALHDVGATDEARDMYAAALDMQPEDQEIAAEYAAVTAGASPEAQALTKFCTQCGARFAETDRFCTHCGGRRGVASS